MSGAIYIPPNRPNTWLPEAKSGPAPCKLPKTEDSKIHEDSGDEEFFASLPPDELTPEELQMRQVLLRFLHDQARIRPGVPPTIDEAVNDPAVNESCHALLPHGTQLSEWIDRRIGGEVTSGNDKIRKCTVLLLDGHEADIDNEGADEEADEDHQPPQKKARMGHDDDGWVDQDLTVFVGGIPYDTDKMKLEEHFQKCGAVANVNLPMKKMREGTRLKGCAFITFKTKAGRDKSLELNGKEYRGRFLKVAFSNKITRVRKVKGKTGDSASLAEHHPTQREDWAE